MVISQGLDGSTTLYRPLSKQYDSPSEIAQILCPQIRDQRRSGGEPERVHRDADRSHRVILSPTRQRLVVDKVEGPDFKKIVDAVILGGNIMYAIKNGSS